MIYLHKVSPDKALYTVILHTVWPCWPVNWKLCNSAIHLPYTFLHYVDNLTIRPLHLSPSSHNSSSFSSSVSLCVLPSFYATSSFTFWDYRFSWQQVRSWLVSWNVAFFSLLEIDQPTTRVMMEAVKHLSNFSVYYSTWHNILENSHLHSSNLLFPSWSWSPSWALSFYIYLSFETKYPIKTNWNFRAVRKTCFSLLVLNKTLQLK